MISKRLITRMTKAMYAFGILFLLTGLLLSAVSFPAMAQEVPPDAPAGAGAIWTTNEGCDNPAAQDDNLYEYGQIVHIRGSNFDPNAALTWEITGQPGSATPGLIASGVGTTDATGYFCVNAHEVGPPEDGTYTVDVYIGNTKKNDNYRVNGIVAAPLLSLVKTATPTTYAAPGDVISYSYLLTNDGNVPLDGPYTVDDDKATVTCPATPNPLPVGDSITCTATYTITQADVDAGSVTNEAIGHAAYNGAAVDSNTDFETVTAAQNPALSLVKTAAPPTYSTVGNLISYDYLLTNSGNVTLVAPFTVTDDKTTVTCPATPTSLAPGASITCTATYAIMQDDLDNGSVTNTATGYGNFNGGQIASNQDDETVTAVQSPSMQIIKTADDASYDHVGQVLTYTYQLINTGNVSLNPTFSVIDDIAGPAVCPQPAVLLPGDSLICTASYMVTQADMDAGSVVNIAVGQGYFGATPVPAGQDTAVVPALVQGPALGLVKTVDPETYANVGDILTYTYQLTNLGDVTLTGFTVTDNKTTVDCSAAVSPLAPGASTTCTATYTITQADIDAGFVTNLATGHGQDPTGAPVDSNEDSATATTTPAPVLTLDKQVDPGTYSNVGDVLNYSYVLTNGGNVTLYAPFTVTDDKVTVDCSAAPATLLPGESTTCTASHTITQADIDAGSITNIATAYAQDPTGAEVTSNDDTATVVVQVQGPSLELVKTADPLTYSSVGDVINYTYDITNNGNVTLDGPFSVFDDKSTDENCPATASLAPGAGITCTATYTITLADLIAGSVTNVAYAQGFFEAAPVLSNDDTATVEADLIAPVVQITAEDSPTCAAIEGEECITFTVNITGLTVGQIEFYADLLGYLTGDDPEVFTQDGEYQVTVCGLWPGIADPGTGVQMELGAYAEWYVDSILQGEMDAASAFVFYDPAEMQEICFPLDDLAFLDPFCYRVDGEWTMAVQLGNPNDAPVDIVWTLNGGPGQALTVPALDKAWLANLELGVNHTVAAVWGTDGFAELKARMNLSDCEVPPPPPPPGPDPDPVPPAEAPVAEAGVLIPVTGVDLGAALGLGFFKSLMIYLGLGFLGMAFIVHGLRSKFK